MKTKKEKDLEKYLLQFGFVLVAFLLIISVVKINNLQEENELLKSQIDSYTIKISCHGFVDIEDLEVEYKVYIEDSNNISYETYKETIHNLNKWNEFENCEVIK